MRVIVNILDPLCGMSQEDLLWGELDDNDAPYRKEEWEIGADVSAELYSKWMDKKTKELYVIVIYENGEKKSYFTTQSVFEVTKTKIMI